MSTERDEERSGEGAMATLWRRAPWWRATIIAATAVTIAAVVFWAENQPAYSPPAPASGTVATSPPKVPQSPAPRPAEDASDRPAAAPAASGQAGSSSPAETLASAAASHEDEQSQAMCHPHLLHAPTSMPQIDVAHVAEPTLGHIKLHLWVNGAGVVAREVLSAATFGTPAERQAEAAFAKELTFSLPNTKECRSREVEVIGDFFERREPTGRWGTYVRLYPRFTFDNAGTLQRAE